MTSDAMRSDIRLGFAGPAAAGRAVDDASRRRPPSGPDRALTYLCLFRRVVVVLALVGAVVAWAVELPWLAAAGLAIATGEWLESSYYTGVLRWGQQRGAVPATGSGAG